MPDQLRVLYEPLRHHFRPAVESVWHICFWASSHFSPSSRSSGSPRDRQTGAPPHTHQSPDDVVPTSAGFFLNYGGEEVTETFQEIVRPSIAQWNTSVGGENRCCWPTTLDCSFSVHYHGGSSITQQHYGVNDPWCFKLRSIFDPEWWHQKHNIFCYRLIPSFKESTHSLETQKSYWRQKGTEFSSGSQRKTCS